MSVSLSAVPTYLSIIKDESAQADKFAATDPTTRSTLAQANRQAPTITSPVGLLNAPGVTATRNSDGSTIYSIAAATDANGRTTRRINIVSVPVPAGSGSIAAGNQITALVSAMNSTGLAVTSQGGTLSVTGANGIDTTGLPALVTTATQAAAAGSAVIPLGSGATGLTAGMVIRDGDAVIGEVASVDQHGNVTLTGASQAAIAAGDQLAISNGITASITATAGTATSSRTLALGSAISGARAGQAIYDNGRLVGTISSIDGSGNVTLTAAAAVGINSGDTLTIAAGAAITGVAQRVTTSAATAAGQTRLPLGAAGVALRPGQVLSLGATTVGTVKSVDGSGNVTLTGAIATAIAQGTTLTVSGGLTQTTTPALSDAANLASIENSYKITQYEANEGQQIPGLDTALYVTRTASSITTIDELMTDTNMLKVVSSNLGYDWNTFGSMSYDQQVKILTKGVKLPDFQNPTKVQQMCERYLTLNGGASGASNPLLSLFGGGGGGANSLLAALLPGGGSSSSGNSMLSLFA